MRVLSPNDLTTNKKFSMQFRYHRDDIMVRNADRELSIRALFDLVKSKYPSRFRGAIIYSEEVFRNNLRFTAATMRKYFGDKFNLFWAVKSAPVKKLVEIAAEESAAFDVGSYEELCLAKDFVSGARIYHTAPGKFDWDLEALAKYDCVSISDNPVELKLLDSKAKSLGKRLAVGLRINPAIESTTQRGIATGTLACKFGLPEISESLMEQLTELSNLDIKILHMHIGSQIAEPAEYERALSVLINCYRRLKGRGLPVDTLDIGGGYPYRYRDAAQKSDPDRETQGEHAFHNYVPYDFEDYISRIHAILKKELGDNLPWLTIEPGRHIAAGTAFALGYVLHTKQYPNGIQWLISSISVSDLCHKAILPDTYFDIHTIGGDRTDTTPTAIGGTLCFSGDILTPPGQAINLRKQIKRQDILLFNNIGAYTIIGSGNFHNMPRLPILLIDLQSNLLEIREQERPYFEETPEATRKKWPLL